MIGPQLTGRSRQGRIKRDQLGPEASRQPEVGGVVHREPTFHRQADGLVVVDVVELHAHPVEEGTRCQKAVGIGGRVRHLLATDAGHLEGEEKRGGKRRVAEPIRDLRTLGLAEEQRRDRRGVHHEHVIGGHRP